MANGDRKYTPERHATIIAFMRTGIGYPRACLLAGLTYQTARTWRDAGMGDSGIRDAFVAADTGGAGGAGGGGGPDMANVTPDAAVPDAAQADMAVVEPDASPFPDAEVPVADMGVPPAMGDVYDWNRRGWRRRDDRSGRRRR